MAASPGRAPQRVCFGCSTLATTERDHCPWCGDRYGARGVRGSTLVAALVLQVVLLVGGLAGLGVLAVTVARDELDDEVDRVERRVSRDIDDAVARIRRDIRGQLAPPTTP